MKPSSTPNTAPSSLSMGASVPAPGRKTLTKTKTSTLSTWAYLRRGALGSLVASLVYFVSTVSDYASNMKEIHSFSAASEPAAGEKSLLTSSTSAINQRATITPPLPTTTEFSQVRKIEKIQYLDPMLWNSFKAVTNYGGKISPPAIIDKSRKRTDAGVDVSDPELYKPADVSLKGDSTTTTVMGMATGYDMAVYQRFVGTLRRSGFKGKIILGIAEKDLTPTVQRYFAYRNVEYKLMKYVPCTYKDSGKGSKIFDKTQCADPYPDIKIRWSRFPLIRDWLQECQSCTGPVLIMDVRDSIFQLDPFGPDSLPVTGLQVYEEHPAQRTLHWLTEWPIRECRGIVYNETMLCSGTTVGTKRAMIVYLEAMYAEMKLWIDDPKCRFDINGDDQSIHNYLFYSGQLPFATAMRNRDHGIVNTVGKEGANIWNYNKQKNMKELNLQESVAADRPYPGSNMDQAGGNRWIGAEFNLTDDEGYFVEADGVTRSRVIHQYDRIGSQYYTWLQRKGWLKDEMPPEEQKQQ